MLHRVRPTDRLQAGFGQPEMFDLAYTNQILHGSRDVFDWDVRVDPVLIEEVDSIRLEALQGCVGDLADVRWPAIEPALVAAFEREAELRRDYHLIANGGERFAHQLFVREGTVGFGRVEERDTTVNSR